MQSGETCWTGSDATHMTLELVQPLLVLPVTSVRLAQMGRLSPRAIHFSFRPSGPAVTVRSLSLLPDRDTCVCLPTPLGQLYSSSKQKLCH